MGSSLGIVSSFLSCVQTVITSVLSFHVVMFSLSFKYRDNSFWAVIFFLSFLPDLDDRKYKTLLEGCCQLCWGAGNSISVFSFHSTHLLLLLILVILALVLASGFNRSVCNCSFSPTGVDIIESHTQKNNKKKLNNLRFL